MAAISRMVAALILSLLLSPTHSQAPAAAQSVSVDGSAIEFEGPISLVQANLAIKSIGAGNLKIIRINSRGGDIVAAMRLGKAIKAAGMDVEVRRYCNSACANYIFPAGRRKMINDGAIVLWHGDARQRDFEEQAAQLENRVRLGGWDALTSREQQILEHRRITFEMQDEFYGVVGLNGKLPRLGQLLVPKVALWTVPIEAMSAFGLSSVSAPEGYGSSDYCAEQATAPDAPARLQCISTELALSVLP